MKQRSTRTPRNGYKWIKLDVISTTGTYIGQLWYETSKLWKPNFADVINTVKLHFGIDGRFILEHPDASVIQPLEHIRYHRANI